MPKVAKSKRNVRAKNKNKRNPTISEQTRSTLMTGMQHFPEGGTIRIPDFIAEVANNATLAGIKTGPRLKNYVKRSLYALDRKFKDDEKLIQVDMDRGTLQITPLGYLRFQDILTEVSEHDVEEGRGMICACALAYETRFGPLKLLTNAQMQLFTDRTRRREEELSRKERELELRERQALRRLEPLAGPSTPGVFSNVTPSGKHSRWAPVYMGPLCPSLPSVPDSQGLSLHRPRPPRVPEGPQPPPPWTSTILMQCVHILHALLVSPFL
ncbi:hypothetical protein B0H17DRAFT_460037 [Mycena rosella]|uniref:Uncharacterized protein n=1 Tax=Mycena rosella TaxID=1033263 RepID=A0AAD7C9W1_MYCRO|nr:hypothetical protein B0H17DRAFT_460037 [Mycena rosella]